MNKWMLGAALTALVALPAVAQVALAKPEMTRAKAEAKAREWFGKVDANADGFVTREEGAAAMQAHRGERRDKAFAQIDKDASGSIDREEFGDRRMHRGGGQRGHGRMAMIGGRMFAMADRDSDGRISRTEAMTGAMAMFDRADANRDGIITREERRAARQAMRG